MLELVFALAVTGVGLLGLLALNVSAVGASRRAERTARAEAIADARLEELGALAVAVLEEGAGRARVTADGDDDVRVSHTLARLPDAPDDLRLLRVEVLVGAGQSRARALRHRLIVDEAP